MMNYRTNGVMEMTLTARRALEIATYYGLGYRLFKRDIKENLIYARENEIKYGKKSAEQYFDGYMADTAAYHNADNKAAKQFSQMAYGE